MLFRFYLHDEKILIPTVAETEEGFYVDVKPVQVFSVSDAVKWKNVIYDALSRGNPVIPTPEQSDAGGSVLMEILNLQKWAIFEKRAAMYTVHSSRSYVKLYRTGKSPDGMWGPGAAMERVFDSRVPWSTIVDALAADIIMQPEAHPVKSGGLMIMPKEPTK